MSNAYALGEDNDISRQGTSIRRVSAGAETTQHVRSRLLFYREEWDLDTTAGVPYHQQVFQKPPDLPNVESLLKTEIIQTSTLEELVDFSLAYDSTTRQLEVTWQGFSIYGDEAGSTVNV